MAVQRIDPSVRQQAEQEAAQYNLDPLFVEAILIQEGGTNGVSNPDPDLTPNGIAHGRMQVHRLAAIDAANDGLAFDMNDLDNDPTNIRVGTRYLAIANRRGNCNGDLGCIAEAYNAGRLGTTEGRRYRQSVMSIYAQLKGGTLPEGTAGPVPETTPRSNSPRVGPDDRGGGPSTRRRCISANTEPTALYPMPPNPFHAAVKFVVGAVVDSNGNPDMSNAFDLTPARPQYLQYFEYRDLTPGDAGADTMANKFRIRVFDPNWDIVTERAVSSLHKIEAFGHGAVANALLAWGYTSPGRELFSNNPINLVAPTRRAWITSIEPNFLGFGVEITIEGFSDECITKMVSRTESHPNPETLAQYGDTIGDIVEFIAKRNGWKTCIEPTVKLTDIDATERLFQQSKESDWELLNNLATMARSVADPNEGPYNVYYEAVTNILHFHPTYRLDERPVRIYTYARQRTGAILSFTPNIVGQMVALLGGSNSKMDGMDLVTHENFTSLGQDELFPTKPLFCPVAPGILLDSGYNPNANRSALREFNTTMPNKQNADAEMANLYLSARTAALTAELKIIGDPLIQPMRHIMVIVYTHNGNLHYTSGIYQVIEALHIIQGGTYETTLKLIRDAIAFDDSSKFLRNHGKIIDAKGTVVPTVVAQAQP